MSALNLRTSMLVGLVSLQAVVVLVSLEPGPFSIDEVTYHRMTRDLVEGRGLSIWNGWQETPSPELESLFVHPAGDRLVAQYPYGWPVIAAPAYALLGYSGIFLMNALAFLGAVLFTFRIGVQLLQDRRAAVVGCAIFGLATFALEYSIAAWPHAAATFFTVACFSLAISSWQHAPGNRAAAWAAAAGLLAGIGATVRLDVVFCVPVIGAPFVFGARPRLREAAALGFGLLPGLAFLSVTNMVRWGNPSPLSYGRGGGIAELAKYLPVLVAGVAAVLVLWAVSRPRVRAAVRRRSAAVMGGAALMACAALLVPAVRELVLRELRGAHTILLDMRALPLDRLEAGMSRSGDGAVIYGGALKKALLQSLPYLVLLCVPLVRIVRHRAESARLGLLFGIPALLSAFFSYSSWHGGLSINMRYLVVALPFTSLLAAVALRDLAKDAHRRWPVVVVAAATAMAAGYLALRPGRDDLAGLEPFLLDLPLMLATLVAIAAGLWLLRPSRAAATVALGLSAVAVIWSALVALDYDARWSQDRRRFHHAIAADTADHIQPDSLLVADTPDLFYEVIEYRDRVRVAVPWMDRFRDTGRLIRANLDRGRPVYAVLREGSWASLRATGALEGLDLHALARLGPFTLAEISRPVPGDAEATRTEDARQ